MSRKTLIILIAVFLSSCEQIVDNAVRSETNNYMISTYAGSYSGSFSGGITGTLSMEVTKLGTAKVILNPSAGISENFQGNITKYGDFEGATSPTGFQILGSLNQVNSSYSGTWKKGNLSGSWQMRKN